MLSGVLIRALEKQASAEAVRGKAQVAPSDARFLSIGVLVDLERNLRAGGHIKCWERLAEAAARSAEPLDFTVYMQGRVDQTEHLAPNSRIVTLRPTFSTRSLPFLAGIPDHTDLAPIHPRLLRRLLLHDVIHTTDAYFAYSRTARLAARLRRIGLVNSVHSAVPAYTRIYSEAIFRRWGMVGRILNGLDLPGRLERHMEARLASHVARCHASLETDRPNARGMRRGIDTARFSPFRRDRDRLCTAFGVAPDRAVLLFAGRLEDGKNVMVAAQAVRMLIDRGLAVHAIFAGEGRRRTDVAALLGSNASLPGTVSQEDLAWLYASSDVFVFPSAIEVLPNVVLEAKASGLPVVVTPGGGGRFVRVPGVDGVVVMNDSPQAWADALAALVSAPSDRIAIGRAARSDIERFQPSWDTVLAEDLLPVWRAAAV